MSIKEYIEKLEKSPLYWLTTSSMENTHSDFWCWIIRTAGVGGLNLFGIEPLEGEIVKPEDVKREWKRFDLYIKTNKREIIIENKIKTTYTDEQLERYSNKSHNSCIKKLVTFFEEPNIKKLDELGWISIRYFDILNNLNSMDLDSEVVKKYIDVLSNLTNLFSEFALTDNKYEIGYSDKINELKKISFDDIYKKFKTQEFEKYLKGYLGNNPEYQIGSYFVSGQGAVTINLCNLNKEAEFNSTKSIIFAITLQGDKYKREFLIGTETTLNKKAGRDILIKNIQWLDLNELEQKNSSMRDKRDYNTFGLKNQYNHLAKYRHFNINQETFPDLSYEAICKFIKEDIGRLENELERIARIFGGEANLELV